MAGSQNLADYGTATSTAAAATINHSVGLITTESLSTAAAAEYSFTLTNACIGASSVVLVTVQNGTNTSAGITVCEVTPAAGSCVIKIKNTNASALNGTILIGFLVAY